MEIINEETTQQTNEKHHQTPMYLEVSKTIPQVNQKKELLLSGGAGAISFQAGYMQGLSQIIPLEVLRTYRVGGISAGSCVGGFYVFSLYGKGQKDMKYWYEKYIRRVMWEVNLSTFGFWQTCDILLQIAKEAYDEAIELEVPIDEAFHLYVSVRNGLFGYKKHLVDKFNNRQQFAEAISCSCSIPFLTYFGLSNNYQGKKAIDGGVTMGIPFRHRDSECIFLNVLPKAMRSYPFVREKPLHITTIDIAEDYQYSFPTDFWLWDEYNADQQFMQGFLAAKSHTERLRKAFKLDC